MRHGSNVARRSARRLDRCLSPHGHYRLQRGRALAGLRLLLLLRRHDVGAAPASLYMHVHVEHAVHTWHSSPAYPLAPPPDLATLPRANATLAWDAALAAPRSVSPLLDAGKPNDKSALSPVESYGHAVNRPSVMVPPRATARQG